MAIYEEVERVASGMETGNAPGRAFLGDGLPWLSVRSEVIDETAGSLVFNAHGVGTLTKSLQGHTAKQGVKQ